MLVRSILKRGESHKTHCEDYILLPTLETKFMVYGVFDGCSSGIESYFASSVFGKIFKNQINKLNNEPISDSLTFTHQLLKNCLEQIISIKNQLNLVDDELLTTINLIVHDTKTNQVTFFCQGDGLIAIDNQITSYDQDNAPHYFIYETDELIDDIKFENWFKQHSQIKTITQWKDIAISTDGVESFEIETVKETPLVANPVTYLLSNAEMINNKAYFGKKINLLRTHSGLNHQDDISIIRLIRE